MSDAGTHFVSFRNDISFDGIERLLIFSPTTNNQYPTTHYSILIYDHQLSLSDLTSIQIFNAEQVDALRDGLFAL